MQLVAQVGTAETEASQGQAVHWEAAVPASERAARSWAFMMAGKPLLVSMGCVGLVDSFFVVSVEEEQ